MEGHGREELFEDVDVSRTVGWFTSKYPVKLEAESEEIGEALKEIKELMRAIPKRGIGYGVLRYVSEDEEVKRRMRVGGKAEVRFNYLGQFDQVFKEEGLLKPAGERSGASQAEENGHGERIGCERDGGGRAIEDGVGVPGGRAQRRADRGVGGPRHGSA